jgi:hypothetical protein
MDKKFPATIARTKTTAVAFYPEDAPGRLASWFASRFESGLAETIGPEWNQVVSRNGRRYDAPLEYGVLFHNLAIDAVPYVELSAGWIETFMHDSDPDLKCTAEELARDLVADWVCYCGRRADVRTQDDIWLCSDHAGQWQEAGQRVTGGWIDQAMANGMEQEIRTKGGRQVINWSTYGTAEFPARF